MDMLSIYVISAKSNVTTNIFVKSIVVQKMAYTFIYDINMSPEHFEIKIKDLCPLQRFKIDIYQMHL